MNNNWKNFNDFFIIKRYNDPKESPAYVFYFWSVIVVLGSIGLWLELGPAVLTINPCKQFNEVTLKNIIINVSCVSLTLVASSVVELLFVKKDLLDNGLRKEDIQSFGLSSLVVIFMLYLFSILNINIFGLLISAIALVYSWWFWWIANAKNQLLNPDDSPIDSIGGALSKENDITTSLKGNLGGFTNE